MEPDDTNKPLPDLERGARLRKLREFRKTSQDQLADLIGVSQGTIQKIENGGNSKYFIKIADVLNCEINWLVTGNGNPPFYPANEVKMDSLPILSWGDAIEWKTWTETAKTSVKERVPMEKQYKNCYVLPVKDDLMISADQQEQSFTRGEYIVVNPNIEPLSDDYVVAHEKGAPEAMLKKYTVVGNKQYLLTHKQIPAIEMNDSIEICGVVIEKYYRKVLVAREIPS